MTGICSYCRGPLTDRSLQGRPWPDRGPATYCCYGCLSLGESESGPTNAAEHPRTSIDSFALRIGIGLLIAAQSMIFGLAVNLEESTPASVRFGIQAFIFAGTLLVIALLGPALFRTAFTELRRGRLTIEALFLLTMSGALAASMQSWISGSGPIYFEVVSVLLVVYSLGKAIGANRRASALAASRQWAGSLSQCRIVDESSRDRMVDVKSVVPGDRVEVRPGETIAVDGIIRQGVGFVSEAPVSGEPFAVVRRPGDRVLAGTASYDATFRIEATATGASRQIDRLLDAVEQARSRPNSLQAQADRLGRLFFPLIVIVAGLTFVLWTHFASWQTGLFNAMSVLLVACPCALGLTTPIVLWSALNRLAERGLIVHDADFVERMAQIDQVYFDKTGTLTDDKFALLDVATLAEGDERAEVLGLLRQIESQSRHPIARAFGSLPEPSATPAQIVSLRSVPGCGLEVTVSRDTESSERSAYLARIGRPEWVATDGTDEEPQLLAKLIARDGHRIDFAIDGKLVAIATVEERLRDSANDAIADARNLDLEIHVITGDSRQRADSLELPNAHAGLLPDDKRRFMAEAKRLSGKPLMVGDGINDASALAEAHVGIALSSGTDLANSSASATLYHGDLRVIPWAVAFSREAVSTVRRSLYRAAAYNLIGIALAAAGILHPVVAALLMVASSLLVAWSAARVGVGVDCCPPTPRSRSYAGPAIVHALALAAQGIIALLLLDLAMSASVLLCCLFAIAGVASAYLWWNRPNISHGLDMTYGMLTLGNLGMLIGWWADNGFARLPNGCCSCLRETLIQPWMGIGMLLGAKVAMLWLMRRNHSDLRSCKTAMFTGGNLGMLIGMYLGGWATSFIPIEDVPFAVLCSFLGMTIGMIGGMLIGTTLLRRAIEKWQPSRSSIASSVTPSSTLETAREVAW